VNREPKPGDYVLATKYRDGDPGDQWCVGYFSHMLVTNSGKVTDRYMVTGENGMFRANGFRRCERISADVGNALVRAIPLIEQSRHSLWYWRRNVKVLKAELDKQQEATQ